MNGVDVYLRSGKLYYHVKDTTAADAERAACMLLGLDAIEVITEDEYYAALRGKIE